MNAEFVDTNLLIYAHDGGAGRKRERAAAILARLFDDQSGALSIQVLSEFYAAATKKLGMKSIEAADIIRDLGCWTIHCPSHADVLRAVEVQRRYRLSWWDALVIMSAAELGCQTLWSEDLSDGQRYGAVTVRNPFV